MFEIFIARGKPSLLYQIIRLVKSVLLLSMTITILGIYFMVVISEHLSCTCTYCWQPVKHCDYEQHISRICPEFLIECVFQCGEYIARKEMKQHCQYQCINAKQILSQQEHKFAVGQPVAEVLLVWQGNKKCYQHRRKKPAV